MQTEVVLEMVLCHAPDEDREAAVNELAQLTLVLFELSDKIFVVHNVSE